MSYNLTLLERWLGMCAHRVILREHPLIIAVTGSIGKSTTKQAIGFVMDSQNPEASTRISIKNYNNELGVPLTILGYRAPGRSPVRFVKLIFGSLLYYLGILRTGIKTFILEMGADRPGDLAYLARIAPPTISVITGITPEDPDIVPVHAANYESIDALVQEKATLIRVLPSDGTAILNADDPRVIGMKAQTKARVYTFGFSIGSDARLINTRILTENYPSGKRPKAVEIQLENFNRLRKITLNSVFGRSSAYSMCAAFLVAAVLDEGLNEEILKRIESKFEGLPGRAKIIDGIKQTTLFDGSYNASPSSVVSALRDLRSVELDSGQRRVACLGEMRELGPRAEEMHERVGKEVAVLHLDFLIACGTLAHAIASGAKKAGMSDDKIRIFEDTPEAGQFLQSWIRPGDVILAKASEGTIDSKGVRMERVVKELMADPLHAKELLVRQEGAWQRK